MRNCYSKNALELVVVHFNLARDDASPLPHGIVTFATLPKGYCPSGNVYTSTSVAQGTDLYSEYGAVAFVKPNGEISCHNARNDVYKMAGTLVFYAT